MCKIYIELGQIATEWLKTTKNEHYVYLCYKTLRISAAAQRMLALRIG